jgi:outer membrane lipoprotein-sorting protein
MLRTLLAGCALAVLAAAGWAADLPDPDAAGLTLSQRFEALIARIGIEQERLRTLEARFVQRKDSELLLAPEESRGTFSYRAPDDLRWDYDAPTNVVVLVGPEEMVTWYRDLNRVERMRVGRQKDHVLKFLGAGASFDTLRRYFTVSATFPKDRSEPYVLTLEPGSSRVARRIASMSLRLDRELFVPVFVRFVEPGGDVTELSFEDLRVNGEIPDERFELELPAGVEEVVLELGG